MINRFLILVGTILSFVLLPLDMIAMGVEFVLTGSKREAYINIMLDKLDKSK